MKLYRFKKEYAYYARTRSGDDTIPENFILVFQEEFSYGEQFASNEPSVWAYEYELDEVEDPEIIKKYEEEMKKDVEILLKKTRTRQRLGSFAFKTEDGLFLPHHSIACHYSFDGTGEADACTWNLFLLKEEQRAPIRELVEWMMNYSPWQHCIARRWDILSCQERTDRAMEGPVPVDMEAPANEVVGFAVAMRVITEHHWVIPTYLALRELGASRAVAFMLTGFVQLGQDGRYSYYPNTDWHHFLNENQHVSDVCKFFKSGYHLENRRLTAFNKVRYNSVSGQIANKNGGEGSFNQVINKYVEHGKGWDVVIEVKILPLLEEINRIWSGA